MINVNNPTSAINKVMVLKSRVERFVARRGFEARRGLDERIFA